MKRFPNTFSALVILQCCLVLFGGRDSLVAAQTPYKQIAVINGGSIEGTVVLSGPAATKSMLEVTKDEKVCGRSKPAASLTVGSNKGVQNAVVFLEEVAAGKQWKRAATPVLVQRSCEYSPHVSVIPAGSSLEIVNDDPLLHNVHLYNFSSTDQTICNIAQPVKGQRTNVDQLQSVKSRFLHATCDAGHPWMSAYIVRAENPYYAVTDAKGRFRLDDVPPGLYQLKMWHEGVKVVKTLSENGKVSKYYFEDPYTTTVEVVVPPHGTVRADFDLVLREHTGSS
ncbi:MAG TPA: carboxypeptidase regulatory-like domain-containing protein [Bacteroidota bacterium]